MGKITVETCEIEGLKIIMIRSLYGLDLQQYRITAPFQADNSGNGDLRP